MTTDRTARRARHARLARSTPCLGLAILIGACDAGPDDVERPVPVTVLTLAERDPPRASRLTGSVTPYRAEQIGFEVEGRLLRVADVGREVRGPAYDESGALVVPGDEIAALDDTRYAIEVRAFGARVAATRKQLEAQRIDLDQVAQAQLSAARARLEAAKGEVQAAERGVEAASAAPVLAKQTLARREEAGAAVSQQLLDEAQRDLDIAIATERQADAALIAKRGARDAARASVTTAEATLVLKAVEIEATQARVTELAEGLARAEKDLGDCILRAPFTGRITRLLGAQGSVVDAGQPVVTLTLMDPTRITVSVSADEDRRIRFGDAAEVYPKHPLDPDREPLTLRGRVFEKAAVADPATRTFRIDLMVRNERVRIEAVEPDTAGLPLVDEVLPAIKPFRGEGDVLFVDTRSILREGDRTFVLRVPDVGFQLEDQRRAVGRHVPERVEIELGDDYFRVVRWDFRSLVDSGDLREDQFVVVDPRPEHVNGIALGRSQWLMRPGDLVPVRFELGALRRGFYVPVTAITDADGRHSVFVVENDRARRIAVSVHDAAFDLRRIEGADLAPGQQLVVRGRQFIDDGDAVRTVGVEDLDR